MEPPSYDRLPGPSQPNKAKSKKLARVESKGERVESKGKNVAKSKSKV
jgi:hypothetical protein